jgi:mRNA-degrading endonuclease toxin of MazEF toxin-antitoxin module
VDSRPGNGLTETTYFQCQQIRTVDQGRMTASARGRLLEADFERILTSLRFTLGLLDRP